jgi:hypothetical protein
MLEVVLEIESGKKCLQGGSNWEKRGGRITGVQLGIVYSR